MANENNEADIDSIPDIVETKEGEVDKTDWKAIALERDELAKKAFGMATRYKTKASKVADKPADDKGKPGNEDKSGELDYGQKAFLIASGIKEADEVELVQKTVKETGKTLDQVVGSKYFQAELKELREARSADDAIPKGGNKGRSAASSRDTVEYWIAKGELPPTDQRELRTKVVNARIKVEKDKSQFTDRPVVGGTRT